jgi:hypothetical protein
MTATRIEPKAQPQTWYRLHPEDESPDDLLEPENQVCHPWGEPEFGPCDKCGGGGETDYECQSCMATGADSDCPSCHGQVHFRGTCPPCDGTGEITDSQRNGVSVFPKREGLLRYLLKRDADIEGKIVSLRGEPTGDLDFDADDGAFLVRPTEILGAEPVNAEELRRLQAGL